MRIGNSPAVLGVMGGGQRRRWAGGKLPHEVALMIIFAEAKAIVRAAGESSWTVGTYEIEDDRFEDASHWLVVRGAAEGMADIGPYCARNSQLSTTFLPSWVR